jgi:hypothetical protein
MLSIGSWPACCRNIPKPGAYFSLKGTIASPVFCCPVNLDEPIIAGAAKIAAPVEAFFMKFLLE